MGFGLGCALANRALGWPTAIKALLGLLLVTRIPMRAEGCSRGCPRVWWSAIKASCNQPRVLVGLLAGLALVYWIPLDRLPSSPSAAGIFRACAFSIPVFFAALLFLFALEFRRVSSPSAALAANVLGAVAGGLLENRSLVTGLPQNSSEWQPLPKPCRLCRGIEARS